jgi:hypothetical protein
MEIISNSIVKSGRSIIQKKLCSICNTNWIWPRSKVCKSCRNKGSGNPFWKKHHTQNTINLIKELRRTKPQVQTINYCIDCGYPIHRYSTRCIICCGKSHVGSNNPCWRGGHHKRSYPKEFNQKLKEWIKGRDDYACAICDATENLSIHHIDYNKHNNNATNLITTCISCNSKLNSNRYMHSKMFPIKYWRRLHIYEYGTHGVFVEEIS